MLKVLTLAKTCEMVPSIRQCEKNRDWSILALQNIRTGKAHYLVICTCPESGVLGAGCGERHGIGWHCRLLGSSSEQSVETIC